MLVPPALLGRARQRRVSGWRHAPRRWYEDSGPGQHEGTTTVTLVQGSSGDDIAVAVRPWRSDADYAAMADVSNACAAVDRLDGFAGPEDYRWMARYLPGFRPEEQVMLAEAGGIPVGFAYARLGGCEAGTGHTVSLQFRATPPWRPDGIDARLLARAEAIGLGLVDAVVGDDGLPRVPETVVEDTEIDTLALLGGNGYRPVRWSHRMTRDLDKPIPDRPLPAGFEI